MRAETHVGPYVQFSFLLCDFKQNRTVSINCRAIPQCQIVLSGLSSCGQTFVMKVGGSFLQLSRHEGARSDSVKLTMGSRHSV
jgi:hypothetical protein